MAASHHRSGQFFGGNGMLSQRLLFGTLFLCFVGICVGCGDKINAVPVSGRVTINGKPLANATVCTNPIAAKEGDKPGPGSTGITDENGEFVLRVQATDAEMEGAVPGKVRLVILENGGAEPRASNDDSAGPRVRRKVPVEYRDGIATYDIPEEGTDAMNIDIETKKRR